MSSDQAAPAASAGLPPDVQAQINMSLGGVVVSNYLSFLTMGIVLSCTWTYFSKFPKDRWMFKALVVLCVAMCIGDTVGTGIWCYDWGVLAYANPTAMAYTHWAFPSEAFLLGTCSLCVQFFYAWRVWMVSMKKNYIVPGIIIMLSTLGWCIVCWMVHILATHELVADLQLVLPTVYVWLGGSVGADVVITASMIYYLDLRFRTRAATQHAPTHGRFRQIIFRTVECNVISLVAQAITVGLFNRPQVGFFFVITDMTLAKIYTFSLLCSLNGRHSDGRENSGAAVSSSKGGEAHPLSDRRVIASNNFNAQVSIQVQRETDGQDWSSSKQPEGDFDQYAVQKVRLDSA
ncbi:hypothetical protein CYLTODRAFT_458024 [Cylindrobasidium torrendii FP15055 ss-10]|uniref:DUF6534 domain-containing protein n=1 Tax=Cylindrobasidium torrendii FP15055 ss-10 TaxID=1314674 RepID=A0A0D7B068_9AGAR|nr:hypothetical protein CYLTODRAFT_458024 [Cylindrobasidium torrendii FP15055 ss-10]